MTIGMQLAILIFGLLALGWVLAQRQQAKVQRLREEGIYPPAGRETDADVDRLLMGNRKIEAIKVYRALHEVDLKASKAAVEQRQKELGLKA